MERLLIAVRLAPQSPSSPPWRAAEPPKSTTRTSTHADNDDDDDENEHGHPSLCCRADDIELRTFYDSRFYSTQSPHRTFPPYFRARRRRIRLVNLLHLLHFLLVLVDELPSAAKLDPDLNLDLIPPFDTDTAAASAFEDALSPLQRRQLADQIWRDVW
ncbi:hypothetical protein ACCO45_009466 [Purpureocillium lilacinum]|uniref:Uncharacterized protein n=1 Tax=Purpureocillium lilacinum TaxID=33203 RepID=A0ACC4DJW4_PURLI